MLIFAYLTKALHKQKNFSDMNYYLCQTFWSFHNLKRKLNLIKLTLEFFFYDAIHFSVERFEKLFIKKLKEKNVYTILDSQIKLRHFLLLILFKNFSTFLQNEFFYGLSNLSRLNDSKMVLRLITYFYRFPAIFLIINLSNE